MMKLRLIGSIICCTLLIAGCGKSPEQILEEAKASHAKGDRQAAVLQIKSLLQDSPDFAAARFLLGQLNLEAGDFPGAEKELRRAQDGKVPADQVLPLLAKALVMQGDGKKVLAEIDPAKVTDPAVVARLHAVRGTAHLLLRQREEAQAEFDKALSLKPGSPDALVGTSRLLAGERKWSEALTAVEKALASEPVDSDALMLKGDLLRASGKLSDAEDAYKKLIAAHPQHVNGLLAIVSLTVAASRLGDAEAYLAAARKASPGNPMTAYFQGLIAFRKNDYKAARDAIGAVLKAAPNHLPSVLLGGAVEFALGSQELAQTRLKYVLERAPRNVYARRVLAASYARGGQTQKALETLDPVISGGLKDPAMLALAGEVYMQLNDYEKAEAFFEKAAALDPKNARMRTGLGLSRLAGGDVDAATADLESAAQLDTTRHQADVLLVASHLQRKNFDQALKAAQALVAKQPESPVGHNLIAAAYLGKRDEKAARAALMKALEVQPTYVPAATNLAQLDLKAGDKVTAKSRFEEIIARDKKNTQAYIALFSMREALGATKKEGEQWLEAARIADPSAVKPVVLLARRMMQDGETKRALELVGKSVAAFPESRELLELMGHVQLAAGEKNRAIGTFGRLASSYPSADYEYWLATAHVANNDSASALKSLRSAVTQRELFPEAQILLADLEARAGRIDEAMKIAARLQAQLPRSPVGWVSHGDALVRAKRFGEALSSYEKALSISPSSGIVLRIHQVLESNGRHQDGFSRLRDWLRRNPSDGATKIYLAERLLRANRYSEAIEEYESLIKNSPQNVVLLNNLAWAYLKLGDRRAVEMAEQAAKLSTDNPAVLDTLGMALMAFGQVDKGVSLLKLASDKSATSPEIRLHYAQALNSAGDKSAAKDQLERLLLEFPRFDGSDTAEKLLATLRQR